MIGSIAARPRLGWAWLAAEGGTGSEARRSDQEAMGWNPPTVMLPKALPVGLYRGSKERNCVGSWTFEYVARDTESSSFAPS